MPAVFHALSPALSAPRRGLERAILLAFLLAGVWLTHLLRPPAPDQAVEGFLAAVARDAVVLSAVMTQNATLASQPEPEIAAVDAVWTFEAARGGGPLVDTMLASPASRRLGTLVAASDGAIRAVIVMDDRGRNAAVSFATTDYFQGDEAKWLDTFAKPHGVRHVSGLERGQFGEAVVCWVSERLADPTTGAAIGAVAVAVNAARARGACGG